jgi:DNA invertase Pin-like site-specific DNA recombinase
MLARWYEERGDTALFYVDINRTGKNDNRPELQRLLKETQSGEIVATTKLGRIARNMRDLKNMLYDLEQKGAKFIAITQNIDTSNIYGRLLLNQLGSLAEFEADLTKER